MKRLGIAIAACAALTAAALGLTPAPAAAFGGAIGPHLGWAKSSDADDGSFLIGGHLQFNLLPIIAVQGALDYRLAESFDLGVPGVEDDELRVRFIPLTVTGRIYLPVSDSFMPFGALGAGWYYVMFDYEDALEDIGFEDSNTNEFGWHVGLGGEFVLTPRLNLYLEARWIFLDAERDLDESVVEDIENFDEDATYLAAGLNIVF